MIHLCEVTVPGLPVADVPALRRVLLRAFVVGRRQIGGCGRCRWRGRRRDQPGRQVLVCGDAAAQRGDRRAVDS